MCQFSFLGFQNAGIIGMCYNQIKSTLHVLNLHIVNLIFFFEAGLMLHVVYANLELIWQPKLVLNVPPPSSKYEHTGMNYQHTGMNYQAWS